MPSGRSWSAAAVSCAASCSQPARPVTLPGLAMMMFLLPMIWFSSIAFFRPSAVNEGAPLWVERHSMPRPSSSFRTSFGGVGRPLEVRRVELHHLVAHLRDCRDRAGQVLHQFVAHRVQLEADGDVLLHRGQRRHRKRRRAGHGEEAASGDVLHAREPNTERGRFHPGVKGLAADAEARNDHADDEIPARGERHRHDLDCRTGRPGGRDVDLADPLHEGPVPDVPDEELIAIRAQFIWRRTDYAADVVAAELRAWRAAIDAADTYDELVLWYEHDLFDQLNLIPASRSSRRRIGRGRRWCRSSASARFRDMPPSRGSAS